MKFKRLVTGLTAVTMLLGSAALPTSNVVNIFTNGSISASAAVPPWYDDQSERFTCGDFEYMLLDDGTASITKYNGADTTANIPSEVNDVTVTEVYYYTFYSKAVEIVNIPATVKKIYDDAILYCYNFKAINVDEDNALYSSADGVLFNKDKTELIKCPTAKNCTTYTVPETVMTIDNSAFEGCTLIQNILLPEGLKEIGKAAFFDCELTKVTIPKSVETIGETAFGYVYNFDTKSNYFKISCYKDTAGENYARENGFKYELLDADENDYKTTADGKYTYLILKDGTVEISRYNGNESTVVVPSEIDGRTVTAIGNFIKAGYDELEPADLICGWINDGSIEGAFEGCRARSIILPNTVTEVKDYAFVDCYHLSEIKLSDNLLSIGVFAFYRCDDLKTLTIPDTVKTLHGCAINYCKNLNTITIPKGVEYIGGEALGYISGDWPPIKLDDFTIKCYAGSAAERYAIENDIPYVYLDSNKPTAVTGLRVWATSNTKVKLTWNKVSGAQGYIIYKYDPAKKNWTRIAKTKTTSNAYLVSGLKAGTTYKFAVKAYKTVNGKEITNTKYPQVVTSTKPLSVDLKATAGKNKATLKWNKQAGVTGYVVCYKASKNAKWQSLGATKNTSLTKAGLVKGKTYYFAVKSYRVVGGEIYSGAYTIKSVKIK